MTSTEFAALFNSTRAAFARVTPLVWGPPGQALAFQLRLRPGDAVLDVCAGTGASALPAAAAVGPRGLVHAIDLADDLLEEGRLTASDRAMRNIDFVKADATTWEPPSEVGRAGYDVLSSSFGVFFLPRMDAAVARLLRLVRPGGRFGLTTWLAGSMDDYIKTYFDVLGRHQPGTEPEQPARRTWSGNFAREQGELLNTGGKLTAWLERLGTENIEINTLSNFVPATDEFAWDFVLGSGLRAPLAALDEPTIEAIRAEFIDLLVDRGVRFVDASALVATATVRR